MIRAAVRLEREMGVAWRTMRTCMQCMWPSSDVRPSDARNVFRFGTSESDGGIPCEIRPVIFFVPERASHSQRTLYIGVKGRLIFDGPSGREKPRARWFSTSVGYFRNKKETLEHILGMHYDVDDTQIDHPVFHGQIGPQADFVGAINQHYHADLVARDGVRSFLRSVRIPSAEMDVFSVFLQICADHLIDRFSGGQQRSAFSRMRESCGIYLGSANRVAELIRGTGEGCFRATRWYGS